LGDYLRVSITGVLWGVGNYGMLLLVDTLGAGKGFTISQLSVVVNALIGVFILKNPTPKSRTAGFILAGSFLATLGGIVLGNLK
jgi:glucose uptake protein